MFNYDSDPLLSNESVSLLKSSQETSSETPNDCGDVHLQIFSLETTVMSTAPKEHKRAVWPPAEVQGEQGDAQHLHRIGAGRLLELLGCQTLRPSKNVSGK